MPGCGAISVAFRATCVVKRDYLKPWKFTCPRCGIDYALAEEELIFQSVPKDWLLARVQPS